MSEQALITWVKSLEPEAINQLLSASRLRDLHIRDHNIPNLVRIHWKKNE